MAHHSRYRHRVSIGRPGSHPVYDRVRELYREKHYERVDAMVIGGCWHVSRTVWDGLQGLAKAHADADIDIHSDLHSPVCTADWVRRMASVFSGNPIEISPILPIWRKRRRKQRVGETTVTFTKPPEEFFGRFASKPPEEQPFSYSLKPPADSFLETPFWETRTRFR